MAIRHTMDIPHIKSKQFENNSSIMGSLVDGASTRLSLVIHLELSHLTANTQLLQTDSGGCFVLIGLFGS